METGVLANPRERAGWTFTRAVRRLVRRFGREQVDTAARCAKDGQALGGGGGVIVDARAANRGAPGRTVERIAHSERTTRRKARKDPSDRLNPSHNILLEGAPAAPKTSRGIVFAADTNGLTYRARRRRRPQDVR